MHTVLPVCRFCLLVCLLALSLVSWGQVSEVLFLVNPASRHGQCAELWEEFSHTVKPKYFISREEAENNTDGRLPYMVKFTEANGQASQQASRFYEEWLQRREAQDQLLIAGVGGDGTISEIVRELPYREHLIFGVLPFGSGNDIARTLRIPLYNMEEAAQILIHGTPVTYGAYHVTAKRRLAQQESSAVLMAVDEVDAGLSAKAGLWKYQHDSRTHISPLLLCTPRSMVYPVVNILTTVANSHPQLQVTQDDAPARNIRGIFTLSCGPTCAGGVPLIPDMDPEQDEGMAAVTNNQWLPRQLVTMVKLATGASTPEVERFPFRQISLNHITGHPPIALQVDGEPLYETPAKIVRMARAYTFLGGKAP
ncbi:diacylglycerol/lipid kinase family protein [Sansalvadorimonas verongulae]|uniref:diacylglycerol/lipid kinase family protein n=1 Tax=Sansalvadorimonas verongulae TaxID=2172824 RepID=UPI0012BD0612|nr:diacylglycerol kinase family protein [Sansalvadorimonas verongulae]MTI14812.1 hypothetical protein [Sansalvadorimonas verongulae]